MMLTRSGVLVDPVNLDASVVSVADVGYALSNTLRWGGHIDPPVSVAQHSIAMARYCLFGDVETPLYLRLVRSWAGLWHDSGESLFGDMPRRIKHRPEMSWYRDAEHECTARLTYYHAPEALPYLAAVKPVDMMALKWECLRGFPRTEDVVGWLGEGMADVPPLPDGGKWYDCEGSSFESWHWYLRRQVIEARRAQDKERVRL